jgi:hypothetical protein
MDEVRERLLAADLDDGNALAVTALELRIPLDVDFLELERDLAPNLLENAARRIAEVAPGSRVKPDEGYG